MSNSEIENREQHTKLRWQFLASSVISVISIVPPFLLERIPAANYASSIFAAVHWTIWMCVPAATYAIACSIVDAAAVDAHRKYPIHVLTWTQLSAFGDQRVSRISYWVLLLIPLCVYFVTTNPLHISAIQSFQIPLSLKLSFFASWFFSVALILYTVGCPKELRERKPLEGIKTLNIMMTEVAEPRINIESPQLVVDPTLDRGGLLIRSLSFFFYSLGLSMTAIILGRSAWSVVSA